MWQERGVGTSQRHTCSVTQHICVHNVITDMGIPMRDMRTHSLVLRAKSTHSLLNTVLCPNKGCMRCSRLNHPQRDKAPVSFISKCLHSIWGDVGETDGYGQSLHKILLLQRPSGIRFSVRTPSLPRVMLKTGGPVCRLMKMMDGGASGSQGIMPVTVAAKTW